MFEKLTKCFEGSNKLIEVIGNICVWGMFGIIFFNTAMRALAGYSLPWAEEISKLLLVWMAMLVTSLALYEGRHVALTFLFEKIPQNRQPIVLLIFDILSLVFGLVLTLSGYYYVYDNMNSVLPASNLPRWALYAALPVGGVLLTLYSIYLIIKRVLQIRGKVPYIIKEKEDGAE